MAKGRLDGGGAISRNRGCGGAALSCREVVVELQCCAANHDGMVVDQGCRAFSSPDHKERRSSGV